MEVKDTTYADTDELNAVFDKFIEDERSVGLTKTEYASNKELLDRDKSAYRLLELAMKHINDYDSLETAAKLISQAREVSHEPHVRKSLVLARKNLVAAHKAMRPRFKTHYTKAQKAAIKKASIDTALEHVADAMMNLKLEQDKRTGQLFDNLTSRASVDLPLSLSRKDAKYLVRTAPVVVSTLQGEPQRLRFNRLENRLFLIYEATFIGVSPKNIKGKPEDFAKEKAFQKFGASVYSEPVYRPADGIVWFLVLNFGAGISYAAFPDYVRTSRTTSVDGQAYSYEDYVRGAKAAEQIELAIKSDRLRRIRSEFETKHKLTYDQIKQLQDLIEYKSLQINALKEEFAKITAFEGDGDGLKANQYGRFDDRFHKIALENYLDSTLPFKRLKEDITKQRVYAREVFYTIKMLQGDVLELTKKIKALEDTLNLLKRQEAARHGIFGKIPVEELE